MKGYNHRSSIPYRRQKRRITTVHYSSSFFIIVVPHIIAYFDNMSSHFSQKSQNEKKMSAKRDIDEDILKTFWNLTETSDNARIVAAELLIKALINKQGEVNYVLVYKSSQHLP